MQAQDRIQKTSLSLHHHGNVVDEFNAQQPASVCSKLPNGDARVQQMHSAQTAAVTVTADTGLIAAGQKWCEEKSHEGVACKSMYLLDFKS